MGNFCLMFSVFQFQTEIFLSFVSLKTKGKVDSPSPGAFLCQCTGEHLWLHQQVLFPLEWWCTLGGTPWVMCPADGPLIHLPPCPAAQDLKLVWSLINSLVGITTYYTLVSYQHFKSQIEIIMKRSIKRTIR